MNELEQLLADLRQAAHDPRLLLPGSRLHAYLAVMADASPDTLRGLVMVLVEGSQWGADAARTMSRIIG